jgi:hypothetical protein
MTNTTPGGSGIRSEPLCRPADGAGWSLMKNKVLILTVAIASVALALFVFRWQSSGPAMSSRPSLAVGEVLADETSRLLGGKGKVVVIARASAKEGQSAANEQISSFAAALSRRTSPRIAATEWLPRPLRPVMNSGDLSAEQLLQLIEKNPDANAIVVFAGLPPFSRPLADKLISRQVKLLAVGGYGATVRRWLEAQVLAVAVIPRFGELPPGTPAPRTVRDWFSQEFEMVTPDSVGRLPW